MEKNEIAKLLEKEYSFEVFKSIYSKCFDFFIKKGKTCFFIKIYENLNSLNKKINEDLINLEKFLDTNSIIISNRTSRKCLKDYIYIRKNIKVFNFETFINYLRNEEIPIYRYGKLVANIDFEKMKEKRIKLGYSLSALAKKLKVSKKHLFEIEIGRVRPSYFLAKKIEKILEEKLIINSNKKQYSCDDKKVFNFSNFCSIKGIRDKDKKYVIPKDNPKALEETEQIAEIFNLKIV
ncbi:MAG: helix-turn-helix domain-containing protein [Candidatus Aenigmatarchaeota archaeon]